MYRFDFDEAASLLTVTQVGMTAPGDAATSARALEQQVLAALARGGEFKILFDASQSQVQEMPSFSELSKLAAVFPNPPQTAVVLSSMLHKLQAQRGIVSPAVRTFTSMVEARAWLKTPKPQAADTAPAAFFARAANV